MNGKWSPLNEAVTLGGEVSQGVKSLAITLGSKFDVSVGLETSGL